MPLFRKERIPFSVDDIFFYKNIIEQPVMKNPLNKFILSEKVFWPKVTTKDSFSITLRAFLHLKARYLKSINNHLWEHRRRFEAFRQQLICRLDMPHFILDKSQIIPKAE